MQKLGTRSPLPVDHVHLWQKLGTKTKPCCLGLATSAEFQDDDVAVVGKGGKAVISIEKEPRLKLAML